MLLLNVLILILINLLNLKKEQLDWSMKVAIHLKKVQEDLKPLEKNGEQYVIKNSQNNLPMLLVKLWDMMKDIWLEMKMRMEFVLNSKKKISAEQKINQLF